VFCFGNYAGDNLNFGAAQEWLRSDGVDARLVTVTDDVASGPPDRSAWRRGVAGMVPVFKVTGAAASMGMDVAEVERVARKANTATRTLGVAFRGCTLPGSTEALFQVAEGQFELGLGIHGEPGVKSVPSLAVGDLAKLLVDSLMAERPTDESRAAVLLNGLGATKYEELFVLWRAVSREMSRAGIQPVLPEVGEFVTSLDMAGCSLSLCWLDDELSEYWVAPADTPGFRRGDVGVLPAFERRSSGVLEHIGAGMDEEAEVATFGGSQLVRRALESMLEAVQLNEMELGRLDSVAGDGDHGTGMTRGMRAAVQATTGRNLAIPTALCSAGRAFADAAGGTSGVLWGLMLEAAGGVLSTEGPPSPADVVAAVAAATATVGRIGGANLGDKTLLDVLIPFGESLDKAVREGNTLERAWQTACLVAEDAAHRTASLEPKVGRARPLASRSVGSPDPGAVSLSLCLNAVGQNLIERGDT
jgi:dihydroxyacetone kinase